MRFGEGLRAPMQALQYQGRDCHFHLKPTERMSGATVFASTNMDATKKARQCNQLENRAPPARADQIEPASSKTIKKTCGVWRLRVSQESASFRNRAIPGNQRLSEDLPAVLLDAARAKSSVRQLRGMAFGSSQRRIEASRISFLPNEQLMGFFYRGSIRVENSRPCRNVLHP